MGLCCIVVESSPVCCTGVETGDIGGVENFLGVAKVSASNGLDGEDAMSGGEGSGEEIADRLFS